MEIKKVSTLFPVKEKKLYTSCNIYYGICECGGNYTGKTEQNTTRHSELTRHILKKVDHITTWTLLVLAPKNRSIRKNVEALFIAQLKHLLN